MHTSDSDRWTVEALALGLRAKRQGLDIETDRKGKYRATGTGLKTRYMTYDEMDRWLTILWEEK